MRRCWIAVALVFAAAVDRPIGAQLALQRPTDEQVTLSEIEVQRLVPLLRLEPGMVIADVGAGLGAWSWRFSQRVAPKGRVYASDIDEKALAALRAFVARENLSNITVVAGAVDSTNLPAGCCDAILLRNVFHDLTQPAAMIRSLADALKPGGRLAIVDYPPRPNTAVPAGVPANRGGAGVPAEVVEREVGAVLRHVTTVPNWAPEGVPSGVPPEIGRPYVVIFEKRRQ